MSDQSTNCQSLGFPKTNTRMQFPAATRSAIPKIYGSIVRSDHLLVKLISTSGAAVATAAAGGFDVQLGGWYCLGPMIIMLSSKLIGYWTFVDIVAIQMDGVVVWRQVSMYLHYWKFVAFTLNAWWQLWYNSKLQHNQAPHTYQK